MSLLGAIITLCTDDWHMKMGKPRCNGQRHVDQLIWCNYMP